MLDRDTFKDFFFVFALIMVTGLTVHEIMRDGGTRASHSPKTASSTEPEQGRAAGRPQFLYFTNPG